MKTCTHIKTISEFHQRNRLSKPEHPLISLVDYGQMYHDDMLLHFTQGFYSIAFKKNVIGKWQYGRQDYDFDEGLMSFFAPNQVLDITIDEQQFKNKPSGWILLIHPDFLWNTELSQKFRQYDFFNYAINEALFLSEKEETIIAQIFANIQHEYASNMDEFSKSIIISQIGLLLNYSQRFYKRQFLTREKNNHEILTRFEKILVDYCSSELLTRQGLPTVSYISEKLHITPDYLSTMLRHITGQNTRQHIQDKVIEMAKEKLSTTSASVSEIAYGLGFEHPQSFSKLFKKRTKLTPLEFRASMKATSAPQ